MTLAIEKGIKNGKTVGTKLTLREYEEIAKMINMGIFLSVSDFLREAIRDKLKATKITKLKDINYEDAKKEVLGYYKHYKESYDYQVAEDLEIDYDLVCQITEELEQEGRISDINE